MSQIPNTKTLAQQFETIFTAHFSAVKYFAYKLLKSEEDSEDIAQDVFTKLWSQPEQWLNNKEIDTYIYVMAKHATFNFIKHKKIEQNYQEQIIEKSLIEELFQSDDVLEPIYYKEVELLIRLVFDRLPERRKVIFKMSRFQNLSNNEIAEKLGLSVRTVEHHLYLALAEMKKMIFIAFFLYFA